MPFHFCTFLQGRLQTGQCCHHFLKNLPLCLMAGEGVMNRRGVEIQGSWGSWQPVFINSYILGMDALLMKAGLTVIYGLGV